MPNLEKVYLCLGVRFSFLISCRKKQQQKEEALSSFFLCCTGLGSCFIFSSCSLFIATLALQQIPVERIAFLHTDVVLLPHPKAGSPVPLAAMQMVGPIGAFSHQPFSPFGVLQSMVEEGTEDCKAAHERWDLCPIADWVSTEVTRLQHVEIPVNSEQHCLSYVNCLIVPRWSHCGLVKQKARLTDRSVWSPLSSGVCHLNSVPHLGNSLTTGGSFKLIQDAYILLYRGGGLGFFFLLALIFLT